MSDNEQEDSQKRALDSSEGTNDEEEKRSTRKKARVDYNEDKKVDPKAKESLKKEEDGNEKEEEEDEEEDDDEIQDVTPASIKPKSEETPEPRPSRTASDDLMGLPMEPTGLEGAGIDHLQPGCALRSTF